MLKLGVRIRTLLSINVTSRQKCNIAVAASADNEYLRNFDLSD